MDYEFLTVFRVMFRSPNVSVLNGVLFLGLSSFVCFGNSYGFVSMQGLFWVAVRYKWHPYGFYHFQSQSKGWMFWIRCISEPGHSGED
jgi:hypothetical protein